MEPDQIDILARTVLCNLEKIDDAEETGLSRQLWSNIKQTDRFDGVHFDFPFFHSVPLTDTDMRAFPDSNAARNIPAPNSIPKTLRKEHKEEFTRAFATPG